MEFEKIKNLHNLAKGMKIQIQKDYENNKNEFELKNEKQKLLEQAQIFLQTMAQETQSQLKFQVEDIVNSALDAVFPNEYDFQLNFEISRGKTEAQLKFLSQKTGREIDPMTASGGGVVDLTSFALRIACFALEQGTDNVIILDEPFRFISRDLQSRAGEILKTLSEKMGIQFIIVTHISEMVDVADKVFEVKKNKDGISEIKEKSL